MSNRSKFVVGKTYQGMFEPSMVRVILTYVGGTAFTYQDSRKGSTKTVNFSIRTVPAPQMQCAIAPGFCALFSDDIVKTETICSA